MFHALRLRVRRCFVRCAQKGKGQRKNSGDTDMSFELDMANVDQALLNVTDDDFPRRRVKMEHKTWWSLLAFVVLFALAMVGLWLVGRPMAEPCYPQDRLCKYTGCFDAREFIGLLMATIFLPASFVPVGFLAQVGRGCSLRRVVPVAFPVCPSVRAGAIALLYLRRCPVPS